MSNELFQGAGKDLCHALLVIMNQIKEQLVYPQALQTCNKFSIYKKGKITLFGNYRGIFRLTVVRSIIDQLIYNNLFVLNAISNYVTWGSEEPCEDGIYNAEKYFFYSLLA